MKDAGSNRCCGGYKCLFLERISGYKAWPEGTLAQNQELTAVRNRHSVFLASILRLLAGDIPELFYFFALAICLYSKRSLHPVFHLASFWVLLLHHLPSTNHSFYVRNLYRLLYLVPIFSGIMFYKSVCKRLVFYWIDNCILNRWKRELKSCETLTQWVTKEARV